MAFASDNRAVTFGFFDRISAMIASYGEARAQHKIYRETFRELDMLSNKELADIGLNRTMIKSVALEAAQNA